MKVAIIGAGVIGRRFANVFTRTGVEIRWVCDINLERAKELSNEFGGVATSSLEKVLSDLEIETVYVGIPPKYHKDVTLRALASGKHVICEKPIALSVKEGEEMILAAKDSGKHTAINLPFRYTKSVSVMKELLAQNFVGNIRKLELKFRFPEWPRAWQNVDWLKTKEQGGPLREVGTHYFFLLGELENYIGNVKKVLALTQYSGEDKCEELCTGMIEFDSGLICTLDLLTGTKEEEENTFRIIGDKQIISFRRWYILEDMNGEVLCDTRESSEALMIKEFMQMKNPNTNVTFEDATNAQKILDAIYESRGKWVEIKTL